MKNHQNTNSFACMALLLASLTAILSGCDPNEHEDASPGEILLEFSTSWNQEPFALGDVVTDHLNHPLRIDNLQMYLAPIEMRNDQGDWVEIKDVSLLDFELLNQRITTSLAVGTYDALRFGMGLPPEINTDIDPASYANSHPLSVPGSAGMFWTWSSGYVFVKYEGKFATEPGLQLVDPLSYHCGTDASYRIVTFDFANPMIVESSKSTEISLNFNAAAALVGADDSVDIVEDPVTHNADGTILGARLMDLMDDAWTLTP